jgi:multicomponent Na+:H+ antiporter subunit B
MSRRTRIRIFLPFLAAFAAFLLWGFVGLTDFGHYKGPYGFVLNRVAVPERHMTNVVTATVFDYRGFDTMGEEFILFASVVGVVLLLRATGREDEEEGYGLEEETTGSDTVRVLGTLMVGGSILVSLWLVAFGPITPGGGFQGGVALAGGAALLFVATGYTSFQSLGNESVLDPIEGIGAGGYVVLGIAGLVSSGAFLDNVLGPGVPGTLWSGGSAAIVNWCAAAEVAAANLVLIAQFLEEYLVPMVRERRS